VRHNVKVPNSNLTTILNSNIDFIGINEQSSDYILITEQEAYHVAALHNKTAIDIHECLDCVCHVNLFQG